MAKLTYERVLNRYITKTVYCEPKAAQDDHSTNKMTQEDRMTIALFGLQQAEDEGDYDTALLC